ncbi:MAG: iron-containing alcohol dehydrogenase [Clostridia bacterium]|nr:iron-containing alcohol dehydrogenase [Clostridia bacterium]
MTNMDMIECARQFHINVEEDVFPLFMQRRKGEKVAILSDETTNAFAVPLAAMLEENEIECHEVVLPSPEPVADEKTISYAREKTKGDTYLLAVGSGTLNDVAKYSGYLDGKNADVMRRLLPWTGFPLP